MKNLCRPEIEDYAKLHTQPESDLLRQLEDETYASMQLPQMLCGRVVGGLLRQITVTSQVRNALEVGTFTGYSGLSIASGLQDDGCLWTCEIDEKHARMAQKYFKMSPHGKKIKLLLGPAAASISSLDVVFDLAFVDADKKGYKTYYEAILPRLRRGGMMIFDNALWSGEVLAPVDGNAKALAELNEFIVRDERVENVLLPIRDGLNLVRKI